MPETVNRPPRRWSGVQVEAVFGSRAPQLFDEPAGRSSIYPGSIAVYGA